MFGLDQFAAVLNPPQAAILAVGASQERAVVRDGEIVARPTMTMTLSCDHRAVDGAPGGGVPRDGEGDARGPEPGALEAEVAVGEPLAGHPVALALDEVHRELKLVEDVEAELVEEADSLDVAGDRANLDRSRTTLTSGEMTASASSRPTAVPSMLLGRRRSGSSSTEHRGIRPSEADHSVRRLPQPRCSRRRPSRGARRRRGRGRLHRSRARRRCRDATGSARPRARGRPRDRRARSLVPSPRGRV